MASEFGPKLIGALLVFIIGLYVTKVISRLVAKGLNKRGIDVSLQSFFGSLISAPDSDIEKAKKVVLDTLLTNQFALKEPASSVNVLKVGDGMITLAIRPFATPAHYWDVFFSVQEEVRNSFARNNIVGPTPTSIVIQK